MRWTLCGNNNFFTQVNKRVSHYFYAMIYIYIYVVFLKTTSQLASGSHYWSLQRCPVLCLCANYIFMIFKYGGNMLRLKKTVAEEHTCIFS